MSGKINTSGHLYKRKTVRDTSGNIIEMFDEANGGWIIKGRMIVNQERYDEIAKIEKDKKDSARAITAQVTAPASVEAERTITPTKLDELEKRINLQDSKLDAILEALKK